MSSDPIRPLSVRSGAHAAAERVHEVPAHLDRFLRGWLHDFLNPDLERRVALRMGVRYGDGGTELGAALNAVAGLTGRLEENLLRPGQLADAIDLALALDPSLTDLAQRCGTDKERFARFAAAARLTLVNRLDQLLDDGGSTLRTATLDGHLRLVHRVDPTTQTAVDRAMSVKDTNAAALLARAWAKAYGREPDPDGAYLDALRAVEALAGPLVLPTSTRRTLNQVGQHLRDDSRRPDPSKRKWELVIIKLGDGTVEPLVAMFDRLWHGNLASRHGDDEMTYREVTLDEARAGVQLAVVCVQWLTDGVLRPRATSTP